MAGVYLGEPAVTHDGETSEREIPWKLAPGSWARQGGLDHMQIPLLPVGGSWFTPPFYPGQVINNNKKMKTIQWSEGAGLELGAGLCAMGWCLCCPQVPT